MNQRMRTALTVTACVVAAVALAGCSAEVSLDSSTAKPTVAASTESAATPSASPDSGAVQPTAAASTAADPAEFTTDSASQLEFLSPDGNTRCVMYGADTADTANLTTSMWGCSLYAADWSESSAQCTSLDCAVGVEARGDAIPTLRTHAGEWLWNASVATLPSGQSLTVDSVTCTSSETGATCADELNGHGFTVTRASHSIW